MEQLGNKEWLIQMARLLKGKALQEWNLLLDEENYTFKGESERLSKALGPSGWILEAQNFCHTHQEENERVSAFIWRMEHIFRVTYGYDKLKSVSRDFFL